jgi:hypothetical protein
LSWKAVSIERKQSGFWWGNEKELNGDVRGAEVGQTHQSLLTGDNQNEEQTE